MCRPERWWRGLPLVGALGLFILAGWGDDHARLFAQGGASTAAMTGPLLASFWWAAALSCVVGLIVGWQTHGGARAAGWTTGVIVLAVLAAALALLLLPGILSGRAAIAAAVFAVLGAAYLLGCALACAVAGVTGAGTTALSETEATRLAGFNEARVDALGNAAAAEAAAGIAAHAVPSPAVMVAAAAAGTTARTLGALGTSDVPGTPGTEGLAFGSTGPSAPPAAPVSFGRAAPRGAPDDLTKIHGIDGEIARKLNLLGIFHYDQLADLGPGERRWLFAQLGYREKLPAGWWRWRYDSMVLCGRLKSAPLPAAEGPDEEALRALAAGAASAAVTQVQGEGAVPSLATLAAASAAGETGAYVARLGLLHPGDSDVSPPAEPYSWQAIVTGESVTLFGAVPQEQTGARLRALAAAASPKRAIIDRQQIVPNAPQGFETAAASALHVAGALREGHVALVGSAVKADGTAEASALAALADYAPPAGFARGAWQIRSAPMPADKAPLLTSEAPILAENAATPALGAPGATPGTKPQMLAAPEGKADDLKRIRGIGKQNEARLNALGIWHFRQIAAWTADEALWIGATLAFPGRIEREDWIAQAKILAEGGETEFARRVDRGEVPTSAGGAPEGAPRSG